MTVKDDSTLYACMTLLFVCDQSKAKLPFRRFAPIINVMDGIAPPLHENG
jgi:hypothetical protein